jgi:hypothetical protein
LDSFVIQIKFTKGYEKIYERTSYVAERGKDGSCWKQSFWKMAGNIKMAELNLKQITDRL